MSTIAAGRLGTRGMVQELLNCCWGRTLKAPDDSDPCPEQASNLVCLHNPEAGGIEIGEYKLCRRHFARVLEETTPHEYSGPALQTSPEHESLSPKDNDEDPNASGN